MHSSRVSVDRSMVRTIGEASSCGIRLRISLAIFAFTLGAKAQPPALTVSSFLRHITLGIENDPGPFRRFVGTRALLPL